MGALRQLTGRSPRALISACCGLVLGLAAAARAHAAASVAGEAQGWNAAVEARLGLESAPASTHTRVAYGRVMDGFRAIYHGNPADPHAPRAAVQVAELLAEQGRELADRKSLRDAAGQYEFVAHAYPESSLAPESLDRAAALLAQDAANDPAELRKVQAELALRYPAFAQSGLRRTPAKTAGTGAEGNAEPRPGPEPGADGAKPAPADTISEGESVPVLSTHAPALVSAIRHWSTASYTRVAIDLGDEVRFQAARVQGPDRIFFDLHHAKLAPQLAGKSFAVTDEGFLTRIRAAQYSDDVTRVVLDVHEVAEYSAFLLPNPYRLIIDIHGKPAGVEARTEAVPAEGQPASSVTENTRPVIAANEAAARKAMPGVRAGAGVSAGAGVKADAGVRATEGTESTTVAKAPEGDHYVPRRSRAQPRETPPGATAEKDAAAAGQGTGLSSSQAPEHAGLPPMPVTDGSAAFGLPTRKSTGSSGSAVAAPRVVIPSRPTTARPVPNTVATRSAAASTEIAAVSEQPGKVEATARPTSQPVVDVTNRSVTTGADASVTRSRKTRESASAEAKASPAIAAPPTAGGETSLLRALGLKIGRIVIDAGHGGHDSGTIGVDGLEEKEVVLDVALRLGKLLHDRLGAEIVYTRADDTFIPLETRTAIANKAQADLFISVHANSSPDPTARGVEVYYLNFTSDPEAMQVASRENAVSTKSVHELSELVRRIALKDKIEESHELASDVDSSLYAGLARGNGALKDRGVKKAPFVVLIGANMPSILAEISFVTNPKDASSLSRPEYRQRVAESLYGGVAHYASNINGRGPNSGMQRAER